MYINVPIIQLQFTILVADRQRANQRQLATYLNTYLQSQGSYVTEPIYLMLQIYLKHIPIIPTVNTCNVLITDIFKYINHSHF